MHLFHFDISEIYRPFHLHNELAYQIKAALNSKSRADVDARIELPFDRFLFIGGLQQAGKLVKRSRGHDVFTIPTYSSFEPVVSWTTQRNGYYYLASYLTH